MPNTRLSDVDLEQRASELQCSYEQLLEKEEYKKAAGTYLMIETLEQQLAERYVKRAEKRVAEYRFESHDEDSSQ